LPDDYIVYRFHKKILKEERRTIRLGLGNYDIRSVTEYIIVGGVSSSSLHSFYFSFGSFLFFFAKERSTSTSPYAFLFCGWERSD